LPRNAYYFEIAINVKPLFLICSAPAVTAAIRRDCLDHVIVLNEAHLRRILKAYFEYYHEARAHLSLERNAPVPREVEPASRGKVISIPQVGGLHHRYARRAA